MKMKANKTRNELNVSDLKTYRLKNEERHKIFTKLFTEKSQKLYRSTSTWIFFREKHFFTQNSWNAYHRGQGPFGTAPLGLFIEKGDGACRPAGLLPQEVSWCTPQITKFIPLSYFTKKLWKPYVSISVLIFLFFFFHFTNIKWNMLTQGFQKFYGSPESHFSTKTGEELAAQLAQAS